MENVLVNNNISDSLEKAITYQDYRTLVGTLVSGTSTSGIEKTEDLAHYTMLNDRRMNRWDKTVKISEDVRQKFSNFKSNVTWLVLTESWCGDAAHVIPVLNKMAELSEHIDLKLVFRDENEDLMNQFLTHGSQSIPKVIIIDTDSNEVLYTYGPRPSKATQLVQDYKSKYGRLTPEFKEDLQTWYNKDKGQNIIDDMVKLLRI